MTTMKSIRIAIAIAGLAGLAGMSPVLAAGEGPQIARQKWPFSGPGGHFDQAQLQRGFQVYREVCAACHSLKRIAFRNLSQKGGPEFPEDRVRGLAASWPNQVPTRTETGETAVAARDKDGRITGVRYVTRPPMLSDRIPGPYKNEDEARSIHGGAYPPDLSLLAKGRNTEYHGGVLYHPVSMLKDIATGYQEGGADYLYALLTSYKENAPAYRREGSRLVPVAETAVARGDKSILRCVSVEKGEAGKQDTCTAMAESMNYNSAYPGSQIAMAQPLRDGQIKYSDGTAGTTSNYAKDVSAFLHWAADPSHDERKRMGWQVLLYLLITSILLYIAKKRVWREAH